MAENDSSHTNKSPPLAFMKALNSTVAYFDPTSDVDFVPSSANPPDPKLILLLSWADARDSHIVKYVQNHRRIYPSSRILLIRCTGLEYCIQPFRKSSLMPAIIVLRELVAENEESGTKGATMLVHVFSNAGASTAVRLWELMSAGFGSKSIPRHATIFDSCPGYGSWGRAHYTLKYSLPAWSWVFSHLIMGFLWMVYIPTGYGWPQNVNAAALNASNFWEREERRTYIYGMKDKAVSWQDIETHAKEAGNLGVNVRYESFEEGTHVAHSRVDGDRYWRVITETWDEAYRISLLK